MDGMLATSEAEKKKKTTKSTVDFFFSRRQTLTIFGMEFNKN